MTVRQTTFIVPRSCRRCHDFRAVLKNGNTLACFRGGKEHGPLGSNITRFIDAVAPRFGDVETVLINKKEKPPANGEHESTKER
jgi:hypothetical protein